MAHKGYEIGARFERRVQRYYEDDGYFVIRSAGSHSLLDLVCGKEGEPTIGIQCRVNGNLTEDEKRALSELGKRTGWMMKLAYRQDKELWFRNL